MLTWGDSDSNFDFGDFDIGGWFDNNKDGNGFDWGNLDFENFDVENFDWDQLQWNNTGWDSFLSGIDFGNLDIDFCPILESAVGLGKEFGIEGKCACDGSVASNLNIGCNFRYQCSEGSPLCTSINVNYTMSTNVITVGACIDFEYDTFDEVCFSYSFDITGETNQSCGATYGGNPCECEIDDFCLQLDCSMYLPGAEMDTCQVLETISADDISSFFPNFPVFDEGYSQTSENIHWKALDWEHIDSKNFKLRDIEWGESDSNLGFGDILNLDPNGSLLCPVLQGFIGMSDEFSSAGGCTCNEGQGSFSMGCSFDNTCISDDLCASVDMKFGFNELGAIDADACVDFTNDVHQRTCVAFDIPVAGTGSSPTCTATYGGKDCKCTIDNDCVAVDCSEHEPTAKVSTCQDFSLIGAGASSFIPDFSLPGNVVTDEPAAGSTGGETDGSAAGSTGDETSSDREASSDSETSSDSGSSSESGSTTTETQLNQNPENSSGAAASTGFAAALLLGPVFLSALF